MDVEGADLDAILGRMKLFERDRPPVWLIGLHGEKQARGVWDALIRQNYETTTIRGARLCQTSHLVISLRRRDAEAVEG